MPTFTFSPLPPTATLRRPNQYCYSHQTFTLTFTVTQTPTFTITETPSHTPDLFPYVFPVQPSNWPGFAKGGHPFPATDIFAPIGTKFVAVTNGTVDAVTYVKTFNPVTNADAGGLSVRILGDDGFHYYGADLSSITYGIRPKFGWPWERCLVWLEIPAMPALLILTYISRFRSRTLPLPR